MISGKVHDLGATARAHGQPVAIWAIVCVAVALAGCGKSDIVVPDALVVLGDSYTNGYGNTPVVTDFVPRECGQSPKSWGYYVQEELQYKDYRNVSCGGAQTVNLAMPQELDHGQSNPPQLDAVGADAKLVLMSMGGNDAGFWFNITTCFPERPKTANPCLAAFYKGGVDKLKSRADQVGSRIAQSVDGIRAKAPNAKIVIAGYPQILPPSGRGCRKPMRASIADAQYMDRVERYLNGVIKTAAESAGAIYVDTYEATSGHDACKPPGVRWVEPLVDFDAIAPVHPNEAGARAVAGEVLKALGT